MVGDAEPLKDGAVTTSETALEVEALKYWPATYAAVMVCVPAARLDVVKVAVSVAVAVSWPLPIAVAPS